jgi:hypothetical protein
MSIIDFPGGKKGKTGAASECFQAFADTAAEYEDAVDDKGQAMVVYLTDAGLMLGGNVADPDGINMLLDMAKHALLSRCFGDELDEGSPYSVH